ncbi:Panacea domain-containing protein [Sphingobacterium bambusae]|uniref:Panacea domain-containing protein n=1 Tax=Sphingobacterium bambusae TaxID=662858 RepID=A0ABW6BJ25_9SPHI|nr:type II toxin-antitoxin system antitoxin SocA domain-containing protein [Sphingobacterium bambusae]WPL49685.1 DUF4065 domain-containing protein [Sphingobacterium bambusae]
MYTANNIADFFLGRYAAEGKITPMKLIKLVYIAHGWYLGLTGKALIDENPEAWKYGPVIPSVYHSYKHFKNSPIRCEHDSEVTTGSEIIDKFLDRIWKVYGKYTGTQLSAKTHMPGTPWDITWNDLKDRNRSSLQILETDIKEHYQQLASKNANG